MKINYYPGCTLKTKAKDLDYYARKSAEKLGVTMEEIPIWQCCGAVYPTATCQGRDSETSCHAATVGGVVLYSGGSPDVRLLP